MRVAYVVDIHDHSEAVASVLGRVGAVDLLVVGGDITTGGGPAEVANALTSWLPLVPRLLAVAGNMDSAAIDEQLVRSGVSVNGRGVEIGGVGFFGVSAAPISPLATPYELDEQQLAECAERGWAMVSSCTQTVFCPHAPPAATRCDRLASGAHVGSTAVRSFVEHRQPDLVLCGHIHESRGVDQIGRTKVVNPGPATDGNFALVEIGTSVEVRLARLGGDWSGPARYVFRARRR